MSNNIELPSLEEIQQMDRKQQQAVEALEVSGNSVKCQRCRSAIPIVGRLTKAANNDRIRMQQRRLEWLEAHYNHISTAAESIKTVKQELAELLEEDSKYDKLRSLPLYSSKISDYRYVRSNCFNKLYSNRRRK